MKFSTLLTLSLVYITTVSAMPTARSATCSNGRKADSDTVRLGVPHPAIANFPSPVLRLVRRIGRHPIQFVRTRRR